MGSKCLAAVKFFLPTFSRLGSDHLPRAHRAVNSWTKLRPGQQRLPVPLVVLHAILGFLLHRGDTVIALMLLFQFRTYIRPGQCDLLKVKQLIPPAIHAGKAYRHWAINLSPIEDCRPGKTGQFDETILYDTETPWIHQFFATLTSNRDPESLLWPIPGPTVIIALQDACRALQLEPLAVCRYSLRHGGASEDILSQQRSLLEVKRRGGWRTDSSLKRYGKEALIQSELRKVHPHVIQFGKLVGANLEHLFFGHVQIVLPSLSVIPARKSRAKKACLKKPACAGSK